MATFIKAVFPMLFDDDGKLVGYVDKNDVERRLDGSPIEPGDTPPAPGEVELPGFTTAGGTEIAAGTLAEQLKAVADLADPEA